MGRRGITLIETVCAAALLAIVTGVVFAALAGIMASQQRRAHELGAMELANRLVLQYLDDPDTMPNPALPVQYAGERYRWTMRQVPVELVPARPDAAAQRAATTSISIDRFELVVVDVWLGEESGGSAANDPGTPSATLTRMIDPLALRNPDSNERLFNDQRKVQEFLDRMGRYTTGARSGGRAGTANPSGARPRPSTPATTQPGSKGATPGPKGGAK